MFGGPHQPESLAVRDSIAKAQIKDSRLYFRPLIQEGKISKYKSRTYFGFVFFFKLKKYTLKGIESVPFHVLRNFKLILRGSTTNNTSENRHWNKQNGG